MFSIPIQKLNGADARAAAAKTDRSKPISEASVHDLLNELTLREEPHACAVLERKTGMIEVHMAGGSGICSYLTLQLALAGKEQFESGSVPPQAPPPPAPIKTGAPWVADELKGD